MVIAMEINIFTSEYNTQILNQNNSKLTDIYYPCLVTNWEISYQSFFKKPRTQKRIIFTNLIKGDSSFGNKNPTSHTLTVENHTVMTATITDQEARAKAKEMLRRYFIHHVRVWSVPKINCLSENIIYFPYAVLSSKGSQKKQSKLILYEPASNLTDKLENFPEIERFYQFQQRR